MLAYLATASALRRRAVRARGDSLVRAGGLAAALPYFVPVPYLVVVFRPGPELPLPDAVRALGLLLAVAGPAFSAWAALTLGRHFDLEVEVHSGHEVVRRGPYAVVRHPVYAGLLLHMLGACLATGNLVLMVGTAFGTLPALVARASAEERLLRAELGPAYAAYAREVPMLVPFMR